MAMRLPTKRARNDDDRILPLINVVFLLLIFFMIAGRLSATDPFTIDPPISASSGEPGERSLLVLVGADGRVALNGQEVAPEALERAVADRLKGGGEADPATPAPAPLVWLKADERAEAVAVVGVLETLRSAGVERLKLLTIPAGP